MFLHQDASSSDNSFALFYGKFRACAPRVKVVNPIIHSFNFYLFIETVGWFIHSYFSFLLFRPSFLSFFFFDWLIDFFAVFDGTNWTKVVHDCRVSTSFYQQVNILLVCNHKDAAAMLVEQTSEANEECFVIGNQHGCHVITCKPAIEKYMYICIILFITTFII